MKQAITVSSHISPWLVRFMYPVGGHILMPLYFNRISVTGQENIPRTGPVIIAPTHRSRWDALVVPYSVGRMASGRDLRFMVTVTEVKGLQGWFIRRLGGFSVDLKRPDISSLRHCVDLLSEGEMVVIFPEGGIFRDRQIHPLKRGVARIALEVAANQPDSGIKILPVSISYSQPYPHWRCDVDVNIGEPIKVADYNSSTIKKTSERLTTNLETALKELHEEKETAMSMVMV